jgi:hypothetical protein
MGKKPLIGVVGFFGLSLGLAGCSDCCMFSRENGPPWKNNLARNNAKNEGWKDAPKAGEATATATTTDPYKTKPAAVDAGNVPTNTVPTNTVTDVGSRTPNEFPSAPAQAPMTAGMQPPNGGALPADVGVSQTPPVAATPTMRPPDDGLRTPSLPPAPRPVIREVYTPQVNTPANTPALDEPPMPSAPKPGFSPSPRSLPEIKGAAHDSMVPPPSAPPAVDPMLATPPPPLPPSVKAPGTALDGVPPLPAPPAPTAPAVDPVPPPVPPPPAPPAPGK